MSELSEYEKKRLRRIKENESFLKTLGASPHTRPRCGRASLCSALASDYVCVCLCDLRRAFPHRSGLEEQTRGVFSNVWFVKEMAEKSW